MESRQGLMEGPVGEVAMWIKPKCGECGIGEYAQLWPTALLACTNPECEHVIAPSDLVDVNDWEMRGGVLAIHDTSVSVATPDRNSRSISQYADASN